MPAAIRNLERPLAAAGYIYSLTPEYELQDPPKYKNSVIYSLVNTAQAVCLK